MYKKISTIIKCNAATLFPGILNLFGISPYVVNIRLTTRCSGKCVTCNHWRREPISELTTGQWKEIFSRLGKKGFSRIIFTGGDILLRPDLIELIEACNEKSLRVSLITNAFSINRRIAEELAAARPYSIVVSLDEIGDGFDDQRGISDAANKVTDACKMLREATRGTGVRLNIVPIIMRDTVESVRDVVEFAIGNGIPVMSFNLIHFTHYFFDNDINRNQYEVDREKLSALLRWLAGMKRKRPDLLGYRLVELDYASRHFDDFRQKKVPCLQTAVKICIDPNGDVRACCSTEAIGNVIEEDLGDILNSKRHIDRVKRCLKKDCPGCSCRHQLNLKLNLSSQIREIAFKRGLLTL